MNYVAPKNYNPNSLSMSDFVKLANYRAFRREVEAKSVLSCMPWPAPNVQRLLYVDNQGLLWGMKDYSTGPPGYYKYRYIDNVTSLPR